MSKFVLRTYNPKLFDAKLGTKNSPIEEIMITDTISNGAKREAYNALKCKANISKYVSDEEYFAMLFDEYAEKAVPGMPYIGFKIENGTIRLITKNPFDESNV